MLQPGQEIVYPSSDGLPMADKDVGRLQMEDAEFALKRWFRDDPGVYVTANLLLYYVQGDVKKVVAPDVFLVRDVGKHDRDTYKLWEEGRPPDVVFEFTSRSSKHLDPKHKVPVYRSIGVKEIYLFDPEGKWLKPRFKALHKGEDGYHEIDAVHGLHSPVLGLELRIAGNRLRFYDPGTGHRLATALEEAERGDREAQRADQEAQRADQQAQRADQEAQRADKETQRADAEARRVAELEELVRRLRATD